MEGNPKSLSTQSVTDGEKRIRLGADQSFISQIVGNIFSKLVVKHHESSDGSLPNEIIEKIFAKPDAKFVGRCKVLSKGWNKAISSKTFLQEHIEHMKETNKIALLFQLEYCYAALFYDAELTKTSPNGRIVYEEERPFEILAATHALAARCDKHDNFYLWNPTTLKVVPLPHPTTQFPDGAQWAQVFSGLSYEADIDDYKLVRIAVFDPPGIGAEVMVFSRNLGIWTRAPNFPAAFPVPNPGVLVAGNLHWRSAVKLNEYFITAFNVKDNSYSSIQMPKVPIMFGIQDLVALDGITLAISCSPLLHGSPYTLWILKDYNDQSSWFKIVIELGNVGVFLNHVTSLQPLNYKKPGRNLIRFRFDLHRYFVVYNIENDTFLLLEDEEEKEGYMTIFKCYEGLHSPSVHTPADSFLTEENGQDVA